MKELKNQRAPESSADASYLPQGTTTSAMEWKLPGGLGIKAFTTLLPSVLKVSKDLCTNTPIFWFVPIFLERRIKYSPGSITEA